MAGTLLPRHLKILTDNFEYESDDEYSIREDFSDSDSDNVIEISLHYSKEDVHALAVKAEQLVLKSTRFESWQPVNTDTSSDSDYESKLSRECFISSEPNIFQRRSSPCRARLNSRRKDWRNSLPECLEYFSPTLPSLSPPLSHSKLASQATTPLSDLWEQEQYLSESQGSESQDQSYARSILNFGEDYAAVLAESFNTESSGSDACLSQPRQRREGRRDTKVSEFEKSKTAAQYIYRKIQSQRKERLFGSCKELEDHLKVCRKNLNLLKERKSFEKIFRDEFSQNYLKNLIKKWNQLTEKLQEMLQQCLEFKALTESIEDVKDELMNLGDVDTNKEDNTGSGLDKCKRSLSRLVQLKEELFHLNLSVHDLICQVSLAGQQRSNVSLLYQSKEEVIGLYRLWEDAHKKVTEAERMYLKLSYVEAAHKCFSDVLANEEAMNKPVDRVIRTEDLLLHDKLARIQKMLDDLKDKIVTNDANDIGNQTKANPVVTSAPLHTSRWTYLLPKLSFISTFLIMSVVSLSWWAAPQCCDFQSSWRACPVLRYSNGPPPI